MKNAKGTLLIAVALAVATPALAAVFWNPDSGDATYHIWRACNPLPFGNNIVRTEVDAHVNEANGIVFLSVRHLKYNGELADRAIQYNELSLAKVHNKHYRWVGELTKEHKLVMIGDYYSSDGLHWYYNESLLDNHGILFHAESKCHPYNWSPYGGVSASARRKENRDPTKIR